MNSALKSVQSRAFCRGMLTFAVLLAVSTARLQAQSVGNNAVCTTSGCNTAAQTTGSASLIDASAVAASLSTNDLCLTIRNIFTSLTVPYPSLGAVIDARGMTSPTCATGTPWDGGTFIPDPSTILLPAGTLVIPKTWTLPSNTHLIGEGDNLGSGTTIQAGASLSGSIILFGSAASTAISVENLNLDGNGRSIGGIVNSDAQRFSFVDHVGLYRILGTGLSVSGSGANDSGPYTNITFDTGSAVPASTTVCVSIYGTTITRGFRNLNCTATGTYPIAAAAVLLDGNNNPVKDVRIVGFYDGLRIGSQSNALNNVLINILGDTSRAPFVSSPVDTIHIENLGNKVSDLTLMGISNSQSSGTYTIFDDLTSADLVDYSVGLYALGKPANGGYARFTTSPNVPTWVSGTSAPTTGSCVQGSMYSCNGGIGCGGHVFWRCPSSSGWVMVR